MNLAVPNKDGSVSSLAIRGLEALQESTEATKRVVARQANAAEQLAVIDALMSYELELLDENGRLEHQLIGVMAEKQRHEVREVKIKKAVIDVRAERASAEKPLCVL